MNNDINSIGMPIVSAMIRYVCTRQYNGRPLCIAGSVRGGTEEEEI